VQDVILGPDGQRRLSQPARSSTGSRGRHTRTTDYQYWHSTRAELLRRLGRREEARAAYRRALDLARTAPERRFLERRIAES
jgi:predicted RNA polymerase sigma factor